MLEKIIYSEKEIQDTCKSIAEKLDERFSKSPENIPIMIGVLKGSLNFMMDLLKYVKSPIITDYVQVSSYEGTKSTGAVVIKKDLTYDISNKTIVIVEDVIDTGFTMKYLTDYFKEKYNPKEIIVVSLFDKHFLRKVDVKVDYVGKSLDEDVFLIGYGLDYNELFRNVPYVFAGTPELIKSADALLEKNK